MKKYLGILLLGLAALSPALAQNKVKLTIESWRNDDLKIWQETILPAFMKKYPNIEVVFAPSAPTEYNAVLDT
ncbi:MAG: sugar ABC transporter substrate-binding protein, partial [Meiothermus silvanus]|nr:sugar ABC transporter substrate-binding protein [Allomeiothermus silvanus]